MTAATRYEGLNTGCKEVCDVERDVADQGDLLHQVTIFGDPCKHSEQNFTLTPRQMPSPARVCGCWVAGLLGKPWIKQYLSEIGLGWIANRKKFGFGLPLQEWFTEGGPVSQRIFSTLRAWAKDHEKLLPKAVRQLCLHPELGAKTQFLTIYNLFLLAEWVNLRKP